jgi:hypothetical protein
MRCVGVQHLMQAMHQMQASAPGFSGGGFSQGFPIPSLDGTGHPSLNHWRV